VLALELVVTLGLAVLTGSFAASRLHVATPVLLLLGGALLGFAPALRGVELPSEAVLLLFLPALLYWESLTTSLREIRNNMRVIVLASTALVIGTAAAVATVAHLMGVPWGPAWVLGAAVAPTDATAVGAIARFLPRRNVTVLRAESLVNDGTALVIYGLAVGITAGEDHLSAPHVGWLFLIGYGGGAVAGVLTAWLAVQARRRLDNPIQENTVSVLTPFVAFLLANLVHGSGVLAVVVCGLMLSQSGPRVVRADTRQQANAFWSLATYLLNGSLFVLVGIQLQSSVRHLTSDRLAHALVAVAAVSAAVIGARFVYVFTTPYIIRALDRRPQQRLRRQGPRPRVVNASAGFRGAVSLAAALAVPLTVDSGAPFPNRDLIIFVVSGVIVVTLVLQGLLLPAIVRWARLPVDGQPDEERQLAQITATSEALDALNDIATEIDADESAVTRLQAEFEEHLRVLQAGELADDQPVLQAERDYRALRLRLLAHKRATIVRLRDQRRIDDTVLRSLQSQLDIEELRLQRRDLSD
jgi:Na+/H+ antiporter